MFISQELFEFIYRAEDHVYVGLLPYLPTIHVEHVLNVLRMDEHLQRTLFLVHDNTGCIALGHVLFELGIGDFAARSFSGEHIPASRKEQNACNDGHQQVNPVHIEAWHLRFVATIPI